MAANQEFLDSLDLRENEEIRISKDVGGGVHVRRRIYMEGQIYTVTRAVSAVELSTVKFAVLPWCNHKMAKELREQVWRDETKNDY